MDDNEESNLITPSLTKDHVGSNNSTCASLVPVESLEVTSTNDSFKSPESPKPRLMIERLVLEDFKSFGGRRVIGPFHKRFSAVVGPNGSGKSNIIDAMLFVFGRRARNIRSNKISELVHKSSSQNQENLTNSQTSERNGNLHNTATVYVFLQDIIDITDDPDNFLVVENSRMVIGRQASINGTSRYLLNGHSTTQAEIINLLKTKGIDLDHNRFLILQGEVELISQMKPKGTKQDEEGLLEYLEDIIGSTKYIPMIEEQASKITVLNQTLNETQSRYNLAKKEMTELHEAKMEAEIFFCNEKKLLQLRLQRLYLRRSHDREKSTKAKEQVELAMEKKISSEKQRSQYILKQEELIKTSREIDRQNAKINKSKLQLEEELKELERKDDENQLRRTICYAKQDKLKKELDMKRKEQPNLAEQAKKLRHDASTLQHNLHTYEEDVSRTREQLSSYIDSRRDCLDTISSKRDSAEQDLAPVQSKVDEVKKELRKLESEIQLISNRRQRAMKQREEIIKAKDNSTVVSSAKSRLLDLAALKMKTKTHDYERIDTNYKEISQELERTNLQYSQAKAKLEEYNTLLHSVKHESKVYTTIMEAVQTGTIKGVHGRLSDLCTIDNIYEKAFHAAFNHGDYFVTDTAEQCHALFKFVRSHDLGRISCLALDKVRSEYGSKMNQNNDIGITKDIATSLLIDQVKVTKPIYRVLFYFSLRNTLVVNNIENAAKIGYSSRIRVVTLNGEVIEVDGRMSAGGSQTSKNKTGNCSTNNSNPVTAQMVAATREDCEFLKKRVDSLKAEYKEKQNIREELIDSISLIKNEIAEYKLDIENEATKIKCLNERLLAIGNEDYTAEETEKIKSLELQKNQKNRELNQYEQLLIEKENVVKKFKQEFAQNGGDEIKRLTEIADKAVKNYEEKQANIRTFHAQAETNLQLVEKYTLEIHELEATVQTLNEKIVMHQKVYDELEQKGAEVQARIDECDQQLTELEKTKNEHAATISAMAQTINEFDLAKVDIDHELALAKETLQNCVLRFAVRSDEIKSILAKMSKLPPIAFISNDDTSGAEVVVSLNTTRSSSQEILECDSPCAPHILHKSSEEENQVFYEENVLAIKHAVRILQREKAIWTADLNKSVSMTKITAEKNEGEEEDEQENEDKANDSSQHENDFDMESGAEPNNTSGQLDVQPSLYHLYAEPTKTTLEAINLNILESDIAILEKTRSNLKGNLRVLEEHALKQKIFKEREKQLNEETSVKDQAQHQLENIMNSRTREFLDGFTFVAAKLKEMYQMITRGGDAELEVIDPADPFHEGVNFSVRPPKKSWKQIQNLSGGEKTLSSLALVFALHQLKPTPLYFMDEIDSALDFQNVSIISTYIREKTRDAQFIIISLRNQMFENSDRLVGIFKTNDITKSISIEPRKYEQRGVATENI